MIALMLAAPMARGDDADWTALVGPPSFKVPAENSSKGQVPSFAAAERMAKRLLATAQTGRAADAHGEFFPVGPFTALKDIPRPWEYHRKLVQWFDGDIAREHERFKGKTTWTFESFKPGSCKWKDKGSEANRIAYWSCYRSRIIVSDGKKRHEIEIRAMINWGARWYVTHLGPIPKV